jgi:PAS domain S-box-containing protein
MRAAQTETQAITRNMRNNEEKMISQKMRLQDERFKNIFNNTNDCIAYLNLAGRILNINRKGLELFGKSKTDLVGKHFSELWAANSKSKSITMDVFKKILFGERPNFTAKVQNRKGNNIEVEVAASLVRSDGKAIGILVVARDVTEQKNIEEKLAESEEHYRVLFEQSPFGIGIATLDGKVINVNKAMAAITRYSQKELQRLKFFSLCVDSEVSHKILETLSKQGAISGFQMRMKRKDGSVVNVLLNASKIRVRGKELLQIRLQDTSELRVAKEKIKASEEKYRGLFEEAMDAIFVADAETGILLDCNRAALKMVGRKKSELIGKHQRILHPPQENTGKFSKTFVQHVNGNGKPILETKVITKNGNCKEVAIKAKVFMLGGRKVIQGIFRDISERNRIEEEMTHERDLLQALLDNVPDTIYYKDANSRFTRINKAQATVLGLKDPDEAMGKTDFDFFTPEHSQDAYRDEQKIVKTGKPVINKVEKIRRADGQFRWVSATKVPVKDRSGQVVGLVGVSRDITESKQIEERMEYQRDLFDALMDNMPDAIYFKDKDSRFIRVSRISCPGMGISSPEEAVGMTDFDFSPKEMAEQFLADDQMVMKSGKPIIGKEEVMLSKVGKIWYSATKMPIRNKDGKVIGLVGISRDITKLKETEEELRHYSTRLEELVEERTKKLREVQRLAAIGETAAMVGHDLRNPLQTVAAIPYMVGQMVQSMPVPVKEIVEKNGLPRLMEMLRDQTVYMNKIVSDLQDYARPVNLELKETNLYAMMNETLSALHVPENVEVNNEIGQDFFATLDSYLMKRVMTNLVLNAVQAMPEGGRLTIKASRNDSEVSLSVQDTGVGILEENMPKLFQPLFTTKAKGQGLGLPVCKRIVEAHRGRFSVTSKVGYGSTFTVHLPLRMEVKHVE